jgi:hypothetical protein
MGGINPKSEYRNRGPARRVGSPQDKSETNSNIQNPNDQNFQAMDLFDFVSNIGEFEFRICFVLRASDFEF